METRQIRDAQDLETGQLIYIKGHAKATYMSDGRTVEDAINSTSGSIDPSDFPQYDNQQAITVQGINNGNGSTYAIPGSDITDGGEYDDMFALKSEIPDITGLATQANLTSAVTQLTTNIAQKQDKLVSGTNIKKINGSDILGSGEITIQTGEANVQSDWNVTDTTSDAYIKNKPTLSTVAKTGSYNDLSNKPTIPSAVTESTVSNWGFTKNTGTVTGVKINGATKNPSNGVVDLGTVITDISGKQDKLVSGTSIATINNNSILGSGNFDLATSSQLRDYQPKLVSGTSIKTINGESILGSGDITISGGGSSSGSAAYPEVNHGTSDTILSLEPNTFHIWDEVESLQLVYKRPTEGIANEYLFQFTSGATATTLMLPDTIKWVGGSAPIIQPNMIYQISILNNLGAVLEFDNAPEVITFYVKLYGDYIPFTCSPNMTWGEFVDSEYNTEYFVIDSSNRVMSGAAVLINQTSSSIIEDGVQYDTFMDV